MPSRRTIVERNLPSIRNELMTGEIDPAVLRTKCRVQDVRFGPAEEEGTTETFVRIKTQIPNAVMPHFIMRKAEDNFVSATSMYRAVFYKTTSAQEKNEMEVIKRDLAARTDDNASGVWIPGSPDALELADTYGIRPWVEALLHAPTKKSAYPDDQRTPLAVSSATSSQTDKPQSQEASTPLPAVTATPSRKSIRERSSSPRKALATAAKKTKKAAKEAIETVEEDVQDAVQVVKKTVVPTTPASSERKGKKQSAVEAHIESPISKGKAKLSDQVAEIANHVAASITRTATGEQGEGDDEDEELHLTLHAEEGQSMADMMAQAKSQVEAANHKDALALSKSGLASPAAGSSSNKKKRELQVDDDNDDENGEVQGGAHGERADGVRDASSGSVAKRSKVEVLQLDLVQEKRKVRALVGLVIGLGATAILPYLV